MKRKHYAYKRNVEAISRDYLRELKARASEANAEYEFLKKVAFDVIPYVQVQVVNVDLKEAASLDRSSLTIRMSEMFGSIENYMDMMESIETGLLDLKYKAISMAAKSIWQDLIVRHDRDIITFEWGA